MSTPVRKKSKNLATKTCFLITPIGSEGDLVRTRVDQWVRLIYEPALGKEYKIIRADKISSPGLITEQIVQNIVDADIVIIDYTELNPNVMYEAAIRHLLDKPYIQIHQSGVRFPFDIHNLRSIPYDPTDLLYPDKLIKDIRTTLVEVNKPGYKQPQIIKDKFDFNKIVSDPERFVNLLKEYIVGPLDSQKKQDAIVTVRGPHDDLYTTRFGRKKIVCPKCKTIKYVDMYDDIFSESTTVGLYPHSSKHYKCNNCGTEFEE